MNVRSSGRLGEALIARGAINPDQLRIALQEQARSPAPLGRLLIALGFITEATLREVLSATLGTRWVDLDQHSPDGTALGCVPVSLARRHHMLPLHFDPESRRLLLAVANVEDIVALNTIRAAQTRPVVIDTVLAGESEILHAIDRAYAAPPPIHDILQELETGRSTDSASPPVVRLVDAMLADAVRRGASDLHFEPEAGFLRIRYRLDGILRQMHATHSAHWPAIAVRIKVMAGMNIAETRAPQDGRITQAINGRNVDFRAATQPTLHGENIVLRVLDRHKGIVPLDRLGLEEDQITLVRRMIARPEGLILVTGPTGSGKTTTLYSILSELNSEGVNIMTLEDPVEYPMHGIRQSQVSEASRLGFAEGVRALLRQDPDVILVGEIRDGETAHMALEAAMTGHQVYSTLHTNSALGAIPRLLDLGVRPHILAGNLIGIIAQRLVRRLCPHCAIPEPAAEGQWRSLLEPLAGNGTAQVWRPVGCPRCDGQGYRGRLAIMELLAMDETLDELVAGGATAGALAAAAQKRGFRSLAEDGLRRILQGATSPAELARVVDLTRKLH